MLPWLPVVLALSANSPFAEGDHTGMQSTRAFLLAELPRAGAPPAFGSYAAWEAWVERLSALGVIEDTRASGGTSVRIRASARSRCASPTSRPRSSERRCSRSCIVSLVERRPLRAAIPAARGDYLQNRWAAARSGLGAELIHPDGDRIVPRGSCCAAELLGGEPPAPEALRQLEVAAAEGIDAVAADLVGRTVG